MITFLSIDKIPQYTNSVYFSSLSHYFLFESQKMKFFILSLFIVLGMLTYHLFMHSLVSDNLRIS